MNGETMHSRILIAATMCLLLSSAASAATVEAFDFLSARESSMGGRHVALADDPSVLLANPAGLAGAPRRFSAADLNIRAIGPVFDIADLFAGGVISNATLTDFLAKNDYKLYAGLDLAGPLALGFTGGGLGFGLFNKTKFVVNVAGASSIKIAAGEDLLLAGGYALRFELGNGHELAAGIGAKGYVRGELATDSMGILEALDFATNPMAIIGQPFTLTTGIGTDLGLRWSWQGKVAVGLACRDIYSPAIATEYADIGSLSTPGASSYVSLPRSLDLGLMWAPGLGRLGEVIDSLVLTLDYKDILDLFAPIPRNPVLNVSMGLETRFLDIVTLRAGVVDALPSAGLSLDLSVFRLSLAAYGSELGLDPGVRPCYNLLVDFEFSY
jgi:hypothetical protein